MDNYQKQFGARVRKRRKELHMTQDELAHKAGYTNRFSISKIEAGERRTTQDKIVLLAQALETTTGYLLGDGGSLAEDDNPGGKKPIPENKPFPFLKVGLEGEAVYTNDFPSTAFVPDFAVTAPDNSMLGDNIAKSNIVYCIKTSNINIYENKIYVVIYKGKLMLRRITFSQDKNIMALVPNNPDFQIDLIDLSDKDKVQIVGYAAGCSNPL